MKSSNPKWQTVPIGALCSLKNGRAFKPSEWRKEGLPIVRIQNLNNPNAPFNRYTGRFDPQHHLEGGELLFAWSGTPGTSFGAHIWRGEQALLNQHIFRVDFDSSLLDKRFFRFAINQKLYELIDVAHGGVGLRHVTKGVFESTEIDLPGRLEQQRIADKLDTVLARVDTCRDRLARVALLLERFRQSVRNAAASGRLTEDWRVACSIPPGSRELMLGEDVLTLPASWQVCSLTEVIDPLRPLCYGVVQPGELRSGGVPLVRVQDMVRSTILTKDLRTVSPEIDMEYKRSRVHSGDLLISVVGTIGRTAFVPTGFNGNIARAIARIAVQPSVSPQWVGAWLNSTTVQWWLRSSSREVARKTLNLSELAALSLALPSPEEQSEIASRLATLAAYTDRVEARLTQAQTAIDRLTPALLAKAFRGELVPQDPNDEPASELLKRLAANRSDPGKREKPRRTYAGRASK